MPEDIQQNKLEPHLPRPLIRQMDLASEVLLSALWFSLNHPENHVNFCSHPFPALIAQRRVIPQLHHQQAHGSQ
jgi:hypothetical protein